MLNELYTLAKSVERFNPPAYHPALKRNAKKQGFVIGIAKDGSVEFLEFRDKEKMGSAWRVESSSKGVSFPGFNLPSPIWKPSPESNESVQRLLALPDNNVEERLAILEDVCEKSSLAYMDFHKKRLQSNIRGFPARLLNVFADCPDEYCAFSELLTRLSNASHSVDEFLKMLTTTALRLCREGKLSAISAVEQLLLGNWNKKKGEFTKQEIPVVCEIAERSQYQYVVVSLQMEHFVNERLQERMAGRDFAASRSEKDEHLGVDAFLGVEAALQDTFPSPKLPYLGETVLMSMVSESPCQIKYRWKDSETFPTGKAVAEAMQNALIFITQPERQGKTWRGVPSPTNDKPDLLLAYSEEKPDSTAFLADLFAESADVADIEEASFEEVAAKVCEALEGEIVGDTDTLIRVLVLSSFDKGRKQLVLSEAFQAKEIFRAAEEWRLAATNRPAIRILLPPTKTKKAGFAAPRAPYPAAMMECLNTQWTNEGATSKKIFGCNLAQIYDVFLKQNIRTQETARRLLSLAIQRTGSLLLAVGHKQHSDLQKELSGKARISALTAISTLSILLFKLALRKETYMNQASFNLGRLLALADQLHYLYCEEVRDEKFPPQLIGNALMNTALQQPVTAIALLARRVLPYQAWARTVQSGEKVGLARYFLKEIGEISQTLTKGSLPDTLLDADRAQMILGYLANQKSAPANNQDSQPDNAEQKGEGK